MTVGEAWLWAWRFLFWFFLGVGATPSFYVDLRWRFGRKCRVWKFVFVECFLIFVECFGFVLFASFWAVVGFIRDSCLRFVFIE